MPIGFQKRQHSAENDPAVFARLDNCAPAVYADDLNTAPSCRVHKLPCLKDVHGRQIVIPSTLSSLPSVHVIFPLCQCVQSIAALAKRDIQGRNFRRLKASTSVPLKQDAPKGVDRFGPFETAVAFATVRFIPPLLDLVRIRGWGLFLALALVPAQMKGRSHV